MEPDNGLDTVDSRLPSFLSYSTEFTRSKL